MEGKEILEKIIQKACNNGYILDKGLLNFTENIHELCSFYKNGYLPADTLDGYECYNYSVKEMLFSHDFAKAFWSKRAVWDLKTWQVHLQEMVLYENPLRYLRKFI